jgi:hypothetical protein
MNLLDSQLFPSNNYCLTDYKVKLKEVYRKFDFEKLSFLKFSESNMDHLKNLSFKNKNVHISAIKDYFEKKNILINVN